MDDLGRKLVRVQESWHAVLGGRDREDRLIGWFLSLLPAAIPMLGVFHGLARSQAYEPLHSLSVAAEVLAGVGRLEDLQVQAAASPLVLFLGAQELGESAMHAGAS